MSWSITTDPSAVAFSQRLAYFPAVRHAVTVREGTHSPADLPANFSFSTSSFPEAVAVSRRAVCERLGFALDDLVVPQQVHGPNVRVVTGAHRGCGACSASSAVPDCDALVTDTAGLLLGITVADCLPVFVLDPVKPAIGLAHSGWRGTSGRIVCSVLSLMAQFFGTNPKDCVAAIGPGIGPEGYEVDERVVRLFSETDRRVSGAFTPTRPGHWTLDLTAVVRSQLAECGVPDSASDVSPWRRDRDPSLFFSHRASPGCPRMGAFLGLSMR